ncbi:MAG: ferredoxin [Patescibacteria group bacterium]
MSLKDPKNPSGPVNIKGMSVKVDRDLCIGAATCIAVAAKAFDLDTEAKAVFLDSADEETKETIIEAAKSCPTAAIIIHDENGKQIYP